MTLSSRPLAFVVVLALLAPLLPTASASHLTCTYVRASGTTMEAGMDGGCKNGALPPPVRRTVVCLEEDAYPGPHCCAVGSSPCCDDVACCATLDLECIILVIGNFIRERVGQKLPTGGGVCAEVGVDESFSHHFSYNLSEPCEATPTVPAPPDPGRIGAKVPRP